ncbi:MULTISPECIES: biliverdin-producing heme oxygenase [unclassified Salinibacterium]|uniref:biliverdin-producing heme oxygenase n=1 Tax=unclassified Salinibacterium TaxID=2632331 RepID=UPI0014217BBF|nr:MULTISPECIES: biliverdin-producing heme oxygenase [unclassified Salinibacterium]
MSVLSFSQALRERTWASHSESEGAGFMSDLMKGAGTREDYIALVVQHYYIYEALEGAEKSFADDPIVQRFATPRLTRLPALEADLEFLLGADWREQISPVPTTVAYVNRIREIEAEGWGGGFIAHHYTRYLGDLSGGQFIAKVMARQFGFETNGIGFYVFDEIADPKQFKEHYREELDATGWSAEEANRVIDEVLVAYDFNTELFHDLSAAKAAA